MSKIIKIFFLNHVVGSEKIISDPRHCKYQLNMEVSPHLNSYTRGLLVRKDRPHLFVTPLTASKYGIRVWYLSIVLAGLVAHSAGEGAVGVTVALAGSEIIIPDPQDCKYGIRMVPVYCAGRAGRTQRWRGSSWSDRCTGRRGRR